MAWLKAPSFLREYFYKRHLRVNRFDAHHEMGFDGAATFGILVDLDEPSTLVSTKEYIDLLQSAKKKTEVLAFKKRIPKEERSDVIDIGGGYSASVFTGSDMNWFEKPQHPSVESFGSKGFDILINANLNNNPSLEYVSAISKATCRVGLYSEETAANYELMISLKDDRAPKLFFEQVDHYLKMIK